MPSLALGTGAGAAEGLDVLLKRLLTEQALKRQESADAESARHNVATEGLTGRSIDENAAYRQEQTATRQATTDENQRLAQERLVQSRVALRPIGANVTDPEFDEESKFGIPSGLYKTSGGGMDPNVSTPFKSGESVALPTLPVQRTWEGTATQQHAAEQENRPKPDQVRKYKVNGQEVDGIVDFKTKRIQALSGPLAGQDITNSAVPYEAPIQPQIVQSGDAYFRVPRTGGPASPVTGQDGNPLGLATTSQTRAMSEGAQKMAGLPDRVQALADRLPDQMFGIIGSRLRDLALKAGSPDEFEGLLGSATQGLDRQTARFATTLGLLISGVARVHGGARGGGSIQMMDYMRRQLGGIASRDVLRGRLDASRDILGMYADGVLPDDDNLDTPGAQAPAAGGGVPQVGQQFNGATVTRVTPLP